jgi:hypothetical protein
VRRAADTRADRPPIVARFSDNGESVVCAYHPRRAAHTVCRYDVTMAEPRKIITAAEMDQMTPQERANAVDASEVRSWDEVPETLKAKVFETARRLGDKRRQRA